MTRRFTGWHMTAIIAGFFGLVIAVNLYMAHAAISTFGGTVVENSYVASQQYNEWLAEADKEAKLGWTVTAARAAGDKVRLVVDDNGVAGLNFVVSAKAEHPLGRAPERVLQFASQGDGSYVSREALPAGRWLLRVEVKRASDRYRMVADIQ